MIHDSAVTTYKNPERAPWALGPSSNYVLSTDPRLSDARYPLTHTHVISDVTGLVEALAALPATVSDGDKGDVSVVTGTWTIDPGTVTYDKMQNVTADSILLGRGSLAGPGAPEEIALGTNLSMSGATLNAVDPFTDAPAGGDLGGTYPDPEVREVSNAQDFISLQDDFNKLLLWVVETFKEIPPELEERFEQAVNAA